MRKSGANRLWDIVTATIRIARKVGAWPSSLEVSKAIGLNRRCTLRYLGELREEGLVAAIGPPGSIDCGWMATAEGARWVGLEVPVLSGEVPSRWYRSNPYRMRAYRRLEALKVRRASQVVHDREEMLVVEA